MGIMKTKKINQVHITGLTEIGENDPELAGAFKTMLEKTIKIEVVSHPDCCCQQRTKDFKGIQYGSNCCPIHNFNPDPCYADEPCNFCED